MYIIKSRRRHHNNKGYRRTKNGGLKKDIDKLVAKLKQEGIIKNSKNESLKEKI